MRSLFLKHVAVAEVQNWLPETFGVASFPICTFIRVRKVYEDKGGIPDARSHDIVDYPRLGSISHINKFKTQRSDGRFDYVGHEWVENLVTELQRNESVVSR